MQSMATLAMVLPLGRLSIWHRHNVDDGVVFAARRGAAVRGSTAPQWFCNDCANEERDGFWRRFARRSSVGVWPIELWCKHFMKVQPERSPRGTQWLGYHSSVARLRAVAKPPPVFAIKCDIPSRCCFLAGSCCWSSVSMACSAVQRAWDSVLPMLASSDRNC